MRPQALDLPCAQCKPPSHLPRAAAPPAEQLLQVPRSSQFTSPSSYLSPPLVHRLLRPKHHLCALLFLSSSSTFVDSRGQRASTSAPFTMFDLFAMLLSCVLFPVCHLSLALYPAAMSSLARGPRHGMSLANPEVQQHQQTAPSRLFSSRFSLHTRP